MKHEISVQFGNEVDDLGTLDADSVYFGERSCPDFFLRAMKPTRISETGKRIKDSGRNAYLYVPPLISQRYVEKVIRRIDAVHHIDAVLTSDIGIASSIEGKDAHYLGIAANKEACVALKDIGFARVRQTLPYYNVLRGISDAIKREVVIYGRIPLNYSRVQDAMQRADDVP